jgi:NAD(P) transhydrogenase subunit alpha
MVASMKPGSVLVDLAVERGGNVEGRCARQGDDRQWRQDRRPPQCARPHRGVRLAALCQEPLTFLETMVDKKRRRFAPSTVEDELVKATMLTDGGAVVHPNFANVAVEAVQPNTEVEIEAK